VDVPHRVAELVDSWCERRCLKALRWVLPGWPLTSGLTDDWASLLDALRNVRAFARDELTEVEQGSVDELASAVERIVYRR